ncbi:hypothetical protein [Roseateles sp.]|uniref:hypothetical protein n=1 Tax=Roseateles sp. TaxID=1971397 RepID=UPI0031D7DEC6
MSDDNPRVARGGSDAGPTRVRAELDERSTLAALLERSYRLALWLRDSGRTDADKDTPASFASFVASSELVELLDEARVRLITPTGMPTPARSSAPPDR